MAGNDAFFKALRNEISKPSPSASLNTASVGKIPTGDKQVAERLAEIEIEEIAEAEVIQQELWKPELPTKFPEIKAEIVAGPVSITTQQRNNICVIAYSLATRNLAVEPEAIYKLWPIEGDPYKLKRAGKRPSITGIQQFLATEAFSENMSERGIDIAPIQGLLPEQIALISILSDSISRASTSARLKKAGISWPKYNGWRRQKPFADALAQAQGGVLSDAIGNADTQLAQMAQNGDLKSIIYMNELIGRGPNNRKAVDAIQFARIVLEAVQKNVNPEQARAISAEIELASKQLGIGA